MITCYEKLLSFGENELKEANIIEANIDAWYLLSYVFSISKMTYLLDRNKEIQLDDEKISFYKTLIRKRKKRIPLQHLTNEQEFMGLEFFVNEHVLIPRQDTEVLVEEVLKDGYGERIIDICTGSGCIAISLDKLGHFKEVVGVDISKEALEVAKRNNEKLSASVNFIESDLFTNVENKTFDCIVSNPPYIRKEVIETLEPEVKDFEPYIALYGPDEGLYFYEKIARIGKTYLQPNGKIYFEIGHDQGDAVSHILKKNGYKDIFVIKDLAGLDRVVKATYGL